MYKHFPGLISIVANLYYKTIELIYFLLRIFPINNSKVIITNYHGKGYGDNGKYIAKEILRRGLTCDLVWLVNKDCNKDFPVEIRTVQYGSFKAMFEEVTAKVWIDNCRKHSMVRKRKNQFYIQTWHGGIALKKIEQDAETNLSPRYVKDARHDSKIANLLISNSDFCTKLYQNSFWYDGEILESGYPRNDILLNNPKDIKKKVYSYYHLKEFGKIVLYAPTFRRDYNTEVYLIKFNDILKVLEKKYGGNWVFLVRLHPNISQKANTIFYNQSVINATDYGDMQELMLASEVLITDYSSTMFEFALMNKPVFLFATDIQDYLLDRDLYFDIFSLPFPVAKNYQQLTEYIMSFNHAHYLEAMELLNKLVVWREDGRAAEKIVDKIEAIIG